MIEMFGLVGFVTGADDDDVINLSSNMSKSLSRIDVSGSRFKKSSSSHS